MPTVPSGGNQDAPPPKKRPTTTTTAAAKRATNKNHVVELYENEYYDPDRESWLSGSGTYAGSKEWRWTSPDGSKSVAPTDIAPPVGFEFESDWKIDVTGAGVRDRMGWEYLWDAGGRSGRRRRRWLRTVTREAAVKPPSAAAAEEALKKKRTKAKKEDKAAVDDAAERALSKKAAKGDGKKKSTSKPKSTSSQSPLLLRPFLRPVRAVRDDWNFKGFGWSFYKSLVVPNGLGVSFRCPLTTHLDWFDRHPAVPAITSSAGVFYPNWTACAFLNVSVPLAVVKFLVLKVYEWLVFGVCTATALTKVVMYVATYPLNALLRAAWDMASKALGDDEELTDSDAAEKKSKTVGNGGHNSKSVVVLLGHPLPPLPPPRKIRYSADVEERVGFSLSWRVSEQRGYEFRVSYWHIFLPTIMHLGGIVGRALDRNREAAAAAEAALSTSDDAEAIDSGVNQRGGGGSKNLFRDKKLVDYLRRRSGTFGVTWGGPNPLPPRLGCSAMLSLSGFYYGDLLRRSRFGLLGRSVGRGSRLSPSSSMLSSSSSSSVSSVPATKKSSAGTGAKDAAKALKASSASSGSTSSLSKSKKDPMVGMEEKVLAKKEKAEREMEQQQQQQQGTDKKDKPKKKIESPPDVDKRVKKTAAAEGGKEEQGRKGGRTAKRGDEEEEEEEASTVNGGGGDEKTKVAS